MRVHDNKTRAGRLVLEKCNDSDVVSLEDTIEHIVSLLEVRSLHCHTIEFNQLFLHKLVSTKKLDPDVGA